MWRSSTRHDAVRERRCSQASNGLRRPRADEATSADDGEACLVACKMLRHGETQERSGHTRALRIAQPRTRHEKGERNKPTVTTDCCLSVRGGTGSKAETAQALRRSATQREAVACLDLAETRGTSGATETWAGANPPDHFEAPPPPTFTMRSHKRLRNSESVSLPLAGGSRQPTHRFVRYRRSSAHEIVNQNNGACRWI